MFRREELTGKKTSAVFIGELVVFYIPVKKLNDSIYGKNGKTPHELFEEFLMENFNAYTLELSETDGFWRWDKTSEIIHDKNARFEVSFQGEGNIDKFIDFISEMCSLLEEEGIYVTLAHKSWLILPAGSERGNFENEV